MASIREKIAGLYVAFFNRAPDEEGLIFWEGQSLSLGENIVVKILAASFASHEKFADLYSGLDNNKFVEAIYINTLGQAGDSEGIEYWTKLIDNGMSKSDMIANFISISLDFNPNDIQCQSLSQAEIDSALQRQAYISNKVTVSLHFTDTLSSLTDLSPSTNPNDVASLDLDPAYQASIKIVSSITYEQSTVNNMIESIDMLTNRSDAIDILNTAQNITPEAISILLDEDAPIFTSSVNAGNIDENSGDNQIVYSAHADDQGSVTYSLKSVDDYSYFGIDSVSGDVTLLGSPDFESKSSYSFSVIATDESGNESLLSVSLGVNDLDEDAPSASYQNLGLGDLSTSDTYGVSALLCGTYWDENTTTITYNFNTSIPDDYYDYGDGTDLTTGWTQLNSAQQTAVNNIFDDLGKLLGISFENVTNDGMIALNIVDMDAGTDGFAFYPGDNPTYAGDIFLSSTFNSDTASHGLERGENGWHTMAHELGHALGLEHPFDGDITLPTQEDDTNHTVMSYTQRDNYYPSFTITETNDGKSIDANSNIIFSQLYSLYDVAALQSIFGVNDTTNTEDDTYTLNFTDKKIETIWDAGGEDTIDLSSAIGSSTIDLNPGSLNSADEYSLSDVITFYQNEVNDSDFNDFISDFITNNLNDPGTLYTGKNNLAISTGTIIENLKTGAGTDIVTDNMVDNNIFTNAGNDSIYIGNGGYDYIDGGTGNDTVYIDLSQDSVTISSLSDGSYDLLANNNSFEANLVGIESVSFNDGVLNL